MPSLEEMKTLEGEDIKPTEAHQSLARFVNENTTVDVTDEQVWAVVSAHRFWQSGEGRKAEREANAQAKKEAAEQAKIERAAKQEERKKEREEKAAAKKAEKERKEAERAAAEAAGEEVPEDDSDLDDADDSTADEEVPTPTKRKRPKKTGVSAGSF